MKSFTNILHNKLVYSRRMTRLTCLLLNFIRKDCSEILDIGCGDGCIDSFLMNKKKELSIKGMDVLIRDKTYIPVIKYDGKHIPLPDKSIDTIMLIDVLHHTEHPKQIMQEVTRVARENIIIKDHIVTGPVSYIKLRLMDYVGNSHYHVQLPYHYLTANQWKKIFKENNLNVQKIENRLNLYTGIFHLLFDENLHFIVSLKVKELKS